MAKISIMKIALTFIFFIAISCKLSGQGLKTGQKAPEIVQTSVHGEMLKLSSLKGQMVLIDFWASWCPPCRKENPFLVETYHQYKNASFKNGEGFTIFSVSLDSKPQAWKNAIKKDKLEWPYHVCDLNGWQNEAAMLYGVRVVPVSYLIDGDGVIVAVNPRGEELENKLKKLQKRNTSPARR